MGQTGCTAPLHPPHTQLCRLTGTVSKKRIPAHYPHLRYNATMEHRKRGRPSTYSHARSEEICKRLATGETLRDICQSDDMPHEATVRGWAATDAHGFFTRYSHARDTGLDCRADRCLAVAEAATGDDFQAARLVVDTYKWYLSKLAPKRYGDQQVASAQAGVTIQLAVLPAGADVSSGSVDLRAMIRGGEVRALPAPGGDDDAS